MIQINLLPYELRPIKRTPLPYIISVLAILFSWGGMAYFWMDAQSLINAKQAEIQTHQQELNKLKDVVEEFNKLTELKKDFADRVEVIQEIVSDRIIWSKYLFLLSRLTPENFWYKSIAETKQDFKERILVKDPTTKKDEVKEVPVKKRVLEVNGYIVQDKDGGNDLNPLLFTTQQDPEFADMFRIYNTKFKDTEFEKYKVREFTLEYLIQDKKEKPEEQKPQQGGKAN